MAWRWPAGPGAEYVTCAEDPVRFERHAIRDGDVLESGTLGIRAVHTPGHTHTHLSYVVSGPLRRTQGRVHRWLAALRNGGSAPTCSVTRTPTS